MNGWKAILSQIAQLSTLKACATCQRPTRDVFCKDCDQQLQACKLLQRTLVVDGLTVISWGRYEGLLKQALTRLKYKHQPEIAQALGLQLGQGWLEMPKVNFQPLVVPIPLHHSREVQRGYNQAQLIAQSFCHITGLKLVNNCLERIRATEAQFGLPAQERLQNVNAAFRIRSHFSKQRYPQPILLIDDIYTTGATIQSATKTLTKANLKVMGAAVAAKA